MWIIINHYKDPYSPTSVSWKVGPGFFRGSKVIRETVGIVKLLIKLHFFQFPDLLASIRVEAETLHCHDHFHGDGSEVQPPTYLP